MAKNLIQKFADGFESFTARLGLGMDNMLGSSSYRPGKKVSANHAELEEMYRTSWVVGRIVEVIAKDMMRSPLDIQGSLEQEEISNLLLAYRNTGIPSRMTNAIQWSRLYGGAVAVMLFDGHDPSQPLELDNIAKGSFKGLYVLDSTQVSPSNEKISELGPLLGYPLYYQVNSVKGLSNMKIHNSRALRFVGVELPERLRDASNSFGDSVIERIYDRIIALDSATHGAANLMFKSFLRVIGVDGYREILAEGGNSEKGLAKMFSSIRHLQSNEGITVIDKEDTFSTHDYTFTGVYDTLQAFSEQISGGSSIPLVRLLGQSPKGFSTGESDLRTYYDTILTQVEDDRRPIDSILFQVLSHHLWGKSLPDDFNIEYNSLYSPTEVEKSAIAMQDAQVVAGLLQAGVITEAQALAELKDASRTTGRFSNITEEDLKKAEEADLAPKIAEGTDPLDPDPLNPALSPN